MARPFSNAKVLSALITKAINSRGFSAAAPQAGAAARSGVVVKKTREEMARSTEKTSWVPDPRTGCYRPENVAEEIDAAELRAMLLKKN
uniref:Late embryogenesis protein-5 n=2 Tax=Jatropha curcas TaxID=180498 RepID=D3GBZ8_JATCU|nr:late embryogenesis protein-5 [Jatropha curcas]